MCNFSQILVGQACKPCLARVGILPALRKIEEGDKLSGCWAIAFHLRGAIALWQSAD